jgi:putative ABC transport system substrate-binding protein
MLKVYGQEENHNSPRFSLTIFAEADGLMSYGTEWIDLFGRVLVEEPTKFELVINLKTDKALGLTIPQSLLQRSD